MKNVAIGIGLLVVVVLTSSTAQQRWVAGYALNWMHSTSNIQELVSDSVYTHLIHFAMGLNADGTYSWDPAIPDSLNTVDEISIAQPAGIKVLMEIFPHLAQMDSAWATLDGRTSSVHWLMNMIRQMKLDGIDWDMETGYPSTWGTFNALLKDSLSAVGAQLSKPLTNSVWTYGNSQSNYTNGEWRYFDRIQIAAYEQTGAYQGWIVWNGYGLYSRGVTLPCYPSIPATGVDASWQKWKDLGVPDSVLMISQAATGRIWQGGHMVANVFGKPTRGGAYQQGDVWDGSYPPNCNNPYLGMPTVSAFEIAYSDIVTTYAAYPTEHDTLAISSSKSVDAPADADDKFVTFADPWAFWKQYRYMVDVRNGGGMSVWSPLSGRLSTGDFPIHDAIKMAKAGKPLPPPPLGNFSASPDTFAAGGGTTTLTWTSANGATVTISPAIGAVAASGSRAVGVSSSLDFILSVANISGEATYRAHVGVTQSGGTGTIAVVDSFSRANSTALGPGWAVPAGRASCGIENPYYTPGGDVCAPYNCGQANGANGRGFNYRTETFGNNQYAEITPESTLPGNRFVYAGVRMGGAMGEGYYAKTDGASTWIVKIDNTGTETTLQTLTNLNFQEYGNDRMKIQVVGNVLKVFKNGVQVSLDVVDNSIESGHPGISITPDDNSSLDDFEGGGLIVGSTPPVARNFALMQNYPNPFNLSTRISYSLPVGSEVTLKVYNLLGQEISTLAKGIYAAGGYSVDFSGERLPSGIYFYTINAGAFWDMRKMVLLK